MPKTSSVLLIITIQCRPLDGHSIYHATIASCGKNVHFQRPDASGPNSFMTIMSLVPEFQKMGGPGLKVRVLGGSAPS